MTSNGSDPAHGDTQEGPLPPELANLLINILTHNAELINGHFIRRHATLDRYGSIIVDITWINFGGANHTQQVKLMPTTPETIAEPAVAMTVPAVVPETPDDPVIGPDVA